METIKNDIIGKNKVIYGKSQAANSANPSAEYSLSFTADKDYNNVLILHTNINISNASYITKLTLNGVEIENQTITNLKAGDVVQNKVSVTYNSSGRSYGTMGLFIICPE